MASNEIYQDRITFHTADFDYALLARFLNYPAGKPVPAAVKSVLETQLLPVVETASLHYQYRMLPISGRDGQLYDLVVGDGQHLQGNLVYRLLRDSTHIIAHLISTPAQLPEADDEDLLVHVFFNTLLQMAAGHLRNVLRQRFDLPDIRFTRRYAPGYCGWPIKDQRVILNLLEPAAIDVRITSGLMLDPIHSLSGIFGLRTGQRISGDMPCYHCTSLSCRVHDDFSQELIYL